MARRAQFGVLVAGLTAIAVGYAPKAIALHDQSRLGECLPRPTVVGTDAPELLTARVGGSRVFAYAGNDVVRGSRAADCLFGGDGQNHLRGGLGDDLLQGGLGHVNGMPRADRIEGGAGDDVIDGFEGADVLRGGTGDDKIEGWSGSDTIAGGPGDDTIGGGTGRNVIDAGQGNDRISSANGRRETVRCGADRDFVRADRGDVLVGCERVRRMASRWPTTYPNAGGRRTTFNVKLVAPVGCALCFWYVRPVCNLPTGISNAYPFIGEWTSRQGRAVTIELKPPRKGWCLRRFTGTVTIYSEGPAGNPPFYPFCDSERQKRESDEKAGFVAPTPVCTGFNSVLGSFSFTVR
jgi:Ca2+-binding RTX toxin-like protein